MMFYRAVIRRRKLIIGAYYCPNQSTASWSIWIAIYKIVIIGCCHRRRHRRRRIITSCPKGFCILIHQILCELWIGLHFWIVLIIIIINFIWTFICYQCSVWRLRLIGAWGFVWCWVGGLDEIVGRIVGVGQVVAGCVG